MAKDTIKSKIVVDTISVNRGANDYMYIPKRDGYTLIQAAINGTFRDGYDIIIGFFKQTNWIAFTKDAAPSAETISVITVWVYTG